MKNKATIGIYLSAVGVFVTGMMLLVSLNVFDSSDIIFARQYNNEVCPTDITTGNFEILFSSQSSEKSTNLFVEVTSPDNVSFVKSNDFVKFPVNIVSLMKFQINSSSLKKNGYESIDNLTLVITATYEKNLWDKIRNTKTSLACKCYYHKQYSQLLLEKDC